MSKTAIQRLAGRQQHGRHRRNEIQQQRRAGLLQQLLTGCADDECLWRVARFGRSDNTGVGGIKEYKVLTNSVCWGGAVTAANGVTTFEPALATVGVIQGTATTSRPIQFALKVLF